MSNRPLILITRPEPQATRFAQTLREIVGSEVEMLVEPLTELRFLDAKIDSSWFSATVFTSANGVAAADRVWTGPRGTAFAVGDRTAQAARDAGWHAVSAGGDAEDLESLLLGVGVRGAVVWPCGKLRTEGFTRLAAQRRLNLEPIEVYEMKPTRVDLARLATAERLIAPVFSLAAAELLKESLGSIHGGLRVVAMSDQVAAAFDTGTRITVASEPTEKAVIHQILALLAEP